jgi:hypothetical protein
MRKGVGVGAPRSARRIQVHSDPDGNRLCHAIADAYPEGTRLAFREVRRVEILYPRPLIIGRKPAQTRLAARSRDQVGRL